MILFDGSFSQDDCCAGAGVIGYGLDFPCDFAIQAWKVFEISIPVYPKSSVMSELCAVILAEIAITTTGIS